MASSFSLRSMPARILSILAAFSSVGGNRIDTYFSLFG